MFKLGNLVQSERSHLKELYLESQDPQPEDSNQKLRRYQQELERRRQKS